MKNKDYSEDEIYDEEGQGNQGEEVNLLPFGDDQAPVVFWKSTEIIKQEVRAQLDHYAVKVGSLDGIAQLQAQSLIVILENALMHLEDSKQAMVALKALQQISDLMWQKESNQQFTIKSNLWPVQHNEASTW